MEEDKHYKIYEFELSELTERARTILLYFSLEGSSPQQLIDNTALLFNELKEHEPTDGFYRTKVNYEASNVKWIEGIVDIHIAIENTDPKLKRHFSTVRLLEVGCLAITETDYLLLRSQKHRLSSGRRSDKRPIQEYDLSEKALRRISRPLKLPAEAVGVILTALVLHSINRDSILWFPREQYALTERRQRFGDKEVSSSSSRMLVRVTDFEGFIRRIGYEGELETRGNLIGVRTEELASLGHHLLNKLTRSQHPEISQFATYFQSLAAQE
jgi:hypothetical protein